MPYATAEQMQLAAGGEARWAELTEWGDGTTVDDIVEMAQLQAETLIDGYSRMRFASLVDAAGNPTASAAQLAASEGVYRIKVARGQNSEADDTAAAARLEIYKAIAGGDFRPAEPAPVKSTAVGSTWVDRDDPETAPVSRCTLKGMW